MTGSGRDLGPWSEVVGSIARGGIVASDIGNSMDDGYGYCQNGTKSVLGMRLGYISEHTKYINTPAPLSNRILITDILKTIAFSLDVKWK